MSDGLLASTDIEEALSETYVQAVATAAGYVIARRSFDRDGIDVTVEAGEGMRPKLDAQLKATVNLPLKAGSFRYPCKRRNYDLLRIQTQVPRILIVLHLPPNPVDWLKITANALILKKCAYWVSLLGFPETENESSVTVGLPKQNRFDAESLRSLMAQSRAGRIG